MAQAQRGPGLVDMAAIDNLHPVEFTNVIPSHAPGHTYGQHRKGTGSAGGSPANGGDYGAGLRTKSRAPSVSNRGALGVDPEGILQNALEGQGPRPRRPDGQGLPRAEW